MNIYSVRSIKEHATTYDSKLCEEFNERLATISVPSEWGRSVLSMQIKSGNQELHIPGGAIG